MYISMPGACWDALADLASGAACQRGALADVSVADLCLRRIMKTHLANKNITHPGHCGVGDGYAQLP